MPPSQRVRTEGMCRAVARTAEIASLHRSLSMGFLSRLFGRAGPTDDGAPFMEHPSGQHDTAVAAMADAIARLRALRKWDRWITFEAQGQGGRVDSCHFAELRLLGDRIDPGEAKLDPELAMARAGLDGTRVRISGSPEGHLVVGQATPRQLALLLDACFRGQMGIRPLDDTDDYAVGAEWSDPSPATGPKRRPRSSAATAREQRTVGKGGDAKRRKQEGSEPPGFAEAREAVWAGDAERLRAVLKTRPGLVHVHGSAATTLLLEACRPARHRAALDVIALLLEAGSDACATNQAGQTGLHSIVLVDTEKCGQPVPEVVRLLVGAGLPVDAVDVAGNTALCNAVFHGFRKETFASIDALLEAGADLKLKNHYGVSAHDLASTLQGADRLRAHLAVKWPKKFQ
jgi:hypothetical protein